MDLRRGVQRAHQRPAGTHRDRDVGATQILQYGEGVAGGLVQSLVARHGADAEQFELGTAQRVENRDGVVHPGIDIENQGDFVHEWLLSLMRRPSEKLRFR